MVEHVFKLVQEKKLGLFKAKKIKDKHISILWNRTNNIIFTPPSEAYINLYNQQCKQMIHN